DRLYDGYPGLIVENCASGAMRSDGTTLRHFSLQSISDQDDYRLYPSIVKGSLLNVLPEQLAVWCMPRPVHCAKKTKTVNQSDLIAFNFVSALAGVPYLGGRIDLCTAEEKALIAYGVKTYVRWRRFVSRSTPRFPLGVTASEKGWDALELACGKKRSLLYVWRLDGEEYLKLPVKGDFAIKQEFPVKKVEIRTEQDGIGLVLKNKYSAVLFSLRR
ncbi:MAG: hypothetical protein ACI4SH_06385, partial [Candidatus Scatosoma sp.]